MIKSAYGVAHGPVTTREIANVIVDLLEKKVDSQTAYNLMKRMDERVHEELVLLSSVEVEGDDIPVVVEKPKEWYIHNAAKAETRGAVLECLLEHLEETNKRFLARE